MSEKKSSKDTTTDPSAPATADSNNVLGPVPPEGGQGGAPPPPGEGPEDPPEGDADAENRKNPHKHDSGAADLERVTDYAEEKELSSAASQQAASLFAQNQTKSIDAKAKERELAKITIRKEDVEYIINEMEVSKQVAERKLREHKGNVTDALRAMVFG